MRRRADAAVTRHGVRAMGGTASGIVNAGEIQKRAIVVLRVVRAEIAVPVILHLLHALVRIAAVETDLADVPGEPMWGGRSSEG